MPSQTKLQASRAARRGLPGAADVGRPRKAQRKDIRRTPAGKFGARLEELAKLASLSASDLGSKIGKSEESVYAYYRGTRTPHIDDWPKIAKALGVNVIDMIPPL